MIYEVKIVMLRSNTGGVGWLRGLAPSSMGFGGKDRSGGGYGGGFCMPADPTPACEGSSPVVKYFWYLTIKLYIFSTYEIYLSCTKVPNVAE